MAERGYAVLSRLDLGADAASLFCPNPAPAPAWVAPLLAAVRAHPRDALVLQGWPLRADSIESLASPPVAAPLAHAFGDAIRSVSPPEAPPPRICDRLESLLAALYAPLGGPPPVRALDCPSLGPHGRAAQHGGALVLATSLAEPAPHPLLQLFHEACHPVTDPAVLARLGATLATRATRRDDPGFATHRALEAAAVAYGTSTLEQSAPDLLPDWRRWLGTWVSGFSCDATYSM